ncbi:hypothetical protein MKW94_002849, partial [Papaver nudicaule]|nr:hypothetical protein [Papaver nudicaule]
MTQSFKDFLFVTSVLFFFSSTTNADDPIGYGYKLRSVKVDASGKSLVAVLDILQNSSMYGPDIQNLELQASFETTDRLRVHITDLNNQRWEIPEQIISRNVTANSTSAYSLLETDPTPSSLTIEGSDLIFEIHNDSSFGFTVSRKSTGDVLFNTTGGNASDPNSNLFVFKDQYIQISTSLPANKSSLYGLGEQTKRTFRMKSGDKKTLWSSDTPSLSVDNSLYGSHPFYIDVRSPMKDGQAAGTTHGVLFLNSNGMDILYEDSKLTYKTIGGVVDFYFFAGPSPKSVINQYTEFIGRPAPMPYWAF